MPERNEKINFLCPCCKAKLTFSTNIIRQNPVLICTKFKEKLNIKTDLDKKLRAMENQIAKMIKGTTIKFKV